MRISNFAAVTMLVLAAAVGIVPAHAQTYSVLYNFGGKIGDPTSPQNTGIIAQGRDGSLYSTSMYGGAKNFGAVFRISPAGTVTTLFSFTDGLNRGHPLGGLTLGTDGNFYGTTLEGTSFDRLKSTSKHVM
jgi:uncharacterized repeat protein (TIGR03803 family)